MHVAFRDELYKQPKLGICRDGVNQDAESLYTLPNARYWKPKQTAHAEHSFILKQKKS